MARKRHLIFVFPVIVFLFSLAGGYFGPRIPVASAATSEAAAELPYNKEVDDFTKIYALVEQNFADPRLDRNCADRMPTLLARLIRAI